MYRDAHSQLRTRSTYFEGLDEQQRHEHPEDVEKWIKMDIKPKIDSKGEVTSVFEPNFKTGQ